jgi:hypothetical protein
MMNVPETVLRDPNLLSNSDLGAWQVAFQSSKCIYDKYIKYLLFTCLSSSGLEHPTTENVEESDVRTEVESFESSLNPLLGTKTPAGVASKILKNRRNLAFSAVLLRNK